MPFYFDSHCHINDKELLPERVEIIERAKNAGVDTLFVIGWDLESSKTAVALAEEFPDVYAMVGFHPENLETVSDEALSEIKELAKHEKVIAIGEIGLDYHWFKDPKDHENQKVWFIKQIELANELNLPICIHAREATGDTLELLKEHDVNKKGVLHCYSGSVESMREFGKLGFYFGFDGPVTFKNSVEPKRCASECPFDRLLIETDSPYMAPVPFRGKRNEPMYIPSIAKTIAELRGIDENQLMEQLWKNLDALFHVKHG